MDPAARRAVLDDLLSFRASIDELLDRPAQFAWDSEEELATLDRHQAHALITRFLSNDLSADDLERWADAIEVREDIAFDVRDSSLLKELVFELANPVLTEPLSNDRARYWLAKLKPWV